VLIPERLPIEEAARAVEMLSDAEIKIGAVILNRVLPANVTGEFYEARRRQEQVYLDEIDRRFGQFRKLTVPQFPSDVCGLENLERVGALLGG
jgi:arsenite-transporting ATPase